MADTTSFETTEITDAQTTEESVQLAQAAAVELSSPGRGKEAAVSAEAGQTYSLKGPQIRFTQEGADLRVHWADGGHTNISDYFVFNGEGTPGGIAGMPYESLTAAIPNFDPDAFTPAAGTPVPTPAPAAGAPQAAGGAFNTEFDGEFGVEGIGIGGLLGQTELQFGLLPINPEILPFFPPAALTELEIGICDGEAQKALFKSNWQRGEGETIVLNGEGSSRAEGSTGDDTIIGDYRSNLLAGDFLFQGTDGENHDLTIEDGGNDLIEGGEGNDTLVGDVYHSDSDFFLDIDVSNYGEGSGQVLDGFNDCLDGGDGEDIIVGDVMVNTSSGTLEVSIEVSNDYGDNNVYNVFNDFLEGGDDSDYDTLVGDVYFVDVGTTATMSLDLEVSNYHGDNNDFDTFNDILWGGNGGGTLVGDVFVDRIESSQTSDIEIELEVSNYQGDGNEFDAFNDILIGGDGEDTMVGDVFIYQDSRNTNSDYSVDLTVSNYEGNGNVFNAFNDHLCGFGDNDVMVGDVFYHASSSEGMSLELSLNVVNYGSESHGYYGYGEGGNGNDNTFNVFNDHLLGGTGDDTLVGDVYILGLDENVNMTLQVSNYEGDNNQFNAFNDVLDASEGGFDFQLLIDEFAEYLSQHECGYGYGFGINSDIIKLPPIFFGEGGATLVGDVFFEGSEGYHQITMEVSNNYGDNNVFHAFEDQLNGGAGDDTLVGDVYFIAEDNPSVGITLTVSNDGGADNSNSSGNNNEFNAFNDMIEGGKGIDLLVGDVYMEGNAYPSISMAVSNNDGDNNTFNAFNDVLDASEGGLDFSVLQEALFALQECSCDQVRIPIFPFFPFFSPGATLVGDVLYENYNDGDMTLAVNNYDGDNNVFSAFEDTLTGGIGDDTLVGDVLVRYSGEGADTTLTVSNSSSDADNNTFNAFNDVIDGSAGGFDFQEFIDSIAEGGFPGPVAATFGPIGPIGPFGEGGNGPAMVGDVFYDISGGSSAIDLGVENYYGNENVFSAYEDQLTGGVGDDTLVGDVYVRGEYARVDTTLTVSNQIGSNNEFNAFNDVLDGGAGADLIVGDVYTDGRFFGPGGDLMGDVSLGVRNGFFADNNTFNAFNDVLDASANGFDFSALMTEPESSGEHISLDVPRPIYFIPNPGATLVGDVFYQNNEDTVSLRVENDNGDNNTFKAFEDTLTGGTGDDNLVGDLYHLDSADTYDEARLEVENFYGNDNVFNAFGDRLTGGAGDDWLVGDVLFDDFGNVDENHLSLSVENFAGYSSSAENNIFNGFNDVLDGGDGDDALVGDVFYTRDYAFGEGGGESRLVLDTRNSGNSADNNTFNTFNDVLMAAAGADLLVGDVFLSLNNANSQTTSLTVSNHAGDNNIFDAFSDTLTGGDGFDILVGDVYVGRNPHDHFSEFTPGAGEVRLEVVNGDGGEGNVINAFNDTLSGGNSGDHAAGGYLVGDVAFDNFDEDTDDDDLSLGVSNSGKDSDGNFFNAFNDILTGGDDEDTLVGDVLYRYGDDNQDLFLRVSNDGGDNNTFSVFNDTLSGGGGDDLLVGDVLFDDNASAIDVVLADAGSNNEFTVFSDTLNGGDGNDDIYGDFVTDGPVKIFTPGVSQSSDTLFEDIIDGGDGDDDIWGQLGNDTLTGNTGADTFHFDGSVGFMDDMDTIMDFSGPGGDDDSVDLDELFDVLGTGDAAARATDISITAGSDAVLTIGSHTDFSITFSGVDLGGDGTAGQFTAAELAALGIDVGS